MPKLLSAGAAAVFPTGTPLDVLVRDVRALTEKAVTNRTERAGGHRKVGQS